MDLLNNRSLVIKDMSHVIEKCTYGFESSLNDNNIISFKTKLIIMSILRVIQIYNLLLYICYFLI